MNLTVKLKLGLSFAALTLIVLLVSALAIVELAKFNRAFSDYVEGVNAREELASALLIAAQRRAVAARNLVLVTSEADLKLEHAAVLDAHRDVQTHLSDLKTAVARSTGADANEEKQLFAEIARVESLYGPVALDIVERAVAGQREEAIVRINQDCIPLLRQLLAAGEVEAERATYETQRNLMIGVCVIAVLLALVWASASCGACCARSVPSHSTCLLQPAGLHLATCAACRVLSRRLLAASWHPLARCSAVLVS